MASQLEIAIGKLCPLADYDNHDGTYEKIVWRDKRPMPTKKEVERQMARADVPQEVWAGAMMRALNTLGILKQVDDLVAASGDLLMQKLWDRAAAFRRDDPMIAAVGAAVSPPWSEDDLDDLFRLAGSFNG